MLLSVPFGERITLGGAQRPRDLAHLLIDIVVPCAGGKCIELRFEIGVLLSLERRRAILETERAMTGGAAGGEGFAALRIAGGGGAQRLPVPGDRRRHCRRRVRNWRGSRRPG